MKLKDLLKENVLKENTSQLDITDWKWWDPKTKTFSFELSDVRNAQPTEFVILRNPKTKNAVKFKLTKIDKDGSGEDIYGWNYISTDGKGYKLLMIND